MTEFPDYVARVYRFALRLCGDHHDAEDITQETFLRAWRKKDSLRDASATPTWLFRIAANIWRDRVRRSKHVVAQATPIACELECGTMAAGEAVAARDEIRRAVQAMDLLPPRQREVLFLHACEGLPYLEISDVLGISPENVKASLSLARKRMRELLKDRLDDPVLRDDSAALHRDTL